MGSKGDFTSTPHMPTLLAVLSCYPVLEAFLSTLQLGALLNLSKINSDFRFLLHNFEDRPRHSEMSESLEVRQDLKIGKHQTSSWLKFKSLCLLECSEPHHTKGENPRGCRMCSMPVCEACIVKSSFGKKENTFQSRRRYMCDDCWTSGNPHNRRIRSSNSWILDYNRSTLCRCTAKDGILCLRCKTEQISEANHIYAYCAGFGCSNEVSENDSAGRICLWCSCVLPGPRSMEESYKLYDSRYLFLNRRSSSTEKISQASLKPIPPRMHLENQKWDPALKTASMEDQKKGSVSKTSTAKDQIENPASEAPSLIEATPSSSKKGKEAVIPSSLPAFSWEPDSNVRDDEISSVSEGYGCDGYRRCSTSHIHCPEYSSRLDAPPSWRETLDDDETILGDPEGDERQGYDEDEITLANHEEDQLHSHEDNQTES